MLSNQEANWKCCQKVFAPSRLKRPHGCYRRTTYSLSSLNLEKQTLQNLTGSWISLQNRSSQYGGLHDLQGQWNVGEILANYNNWGPEPLGATLPSVSVLLLNFRRTLCHRKVNPIEEIKKQFPRKYN